MNTTKCPTCNAPVKMTWSGLDLVAETGDETLASKHYEFEPTALNTVLAVSDQPKFSIEEVIESIKTLWIKDFGRLDSNSPDRDGYFVCGFVHEALMAACASGAVDKTVSDGNCAINKFNPDDSHLFSNGG